MKLARVVRGIAFTKFPGSIATLFRLRLKKWAAVPLLIEWPLRVSSVLRLTLGDIYTTVKALQKKVT